MKRILRVALLVTAIAAVVWLWRESPSTLSATALILDITGGHETALSRWPIARQTVTTRDVTVPARHGAVHTRLYLPAKPTGKTIVVFPGVHGGGVEEPRMSALSRKLAAAGLTVLSAPLPELRVYTIGTRSTDDIEDVAGWLAAQRDLAPSGQIGIVGVSFAGGLALVAAGRPSLAGKLTLVAALGTHADLPRAMHYLCTGELPDRTVVPPHDYGSVVIMLAALPHFAPPEQVADLRSAVLTFLDASSYDSSDKARSAALFTEARRLEATLPEPSRTVMSWVNNRDVKTMGPKLLPYLEELGGAAALSPERSPATRVPVFLLHGAHDNVIPYAETPRLEAYLRAQGNGRVTSLLTPLISHANVQAAPSAVDVWRLIRFWAGTLRAL